jgi:hypothetical protein
MQQRHKTLGVECDTTLSLLVFFFFFSDDEG